MEKGFYAAPGTVSSMPCTSPMAAGGYPGHKFHAAAPAYGSFAGSGGFGGSGQYFPSNIGPTQVMPTQVAPARVSPTQNIVNTNVMKCIVPHIHPSHTTIVNEHLFEHQHHFPHTTSVVNKCCSRHVLCGPPPVSPCRPFC